MIEFVDYTKMTEEEYYQQMLKARNSKEQNGGENMISQYRNALQEIEEKLTTTIMMASYDATTDKIGSIDEIKDFINFYEGLLIMLKHSQALTSGSDIRKLENEPSFDDFKIGLTD